MEEESGETFQQMLNKMRDLEKRVNDPKKLNTKQTIELQNDMVNATFKMVCMILPKMELLANQQETISELKEENTALQKRVTELELERSSKAVIVKNLAPKKGAKKETQILLKENFERVLKKLDIDNEVKVCNIYRLKSKDESRKSETDPIRVEFTSPVERGLFFAKLKKLKGSIFKDLQVGIDVPKHLMKSYKSLDETAFNFRKKYENSKTRIVTQKGSLILLAKKESEINFTEIVDEV